ncbi:hypothetical protein J9303_15150 [Bacillaceae bacterium Marseille-Q3522]|nr:hypothetical protein [Bacillaceae bacterium Marseille-Q3522]
MVSETKKAKKLNFPFKVTVTAKGQITSPKNLRDVKYATMFTGKSSYKRVLSHGHILDENGRKIAMDFSFSARFLRKI